MNNFQEKNLKRVTPLKESLKGTITIPADKSISHRALMIGGLAKGTVEIVNFSLGGDCKSTLGIIEKLGTEVTFKDRNHLFITNKTGFREPIDVLDAGNSGTTTRLMTGILAGQDFYSVITGDSSLRARPMARVIAPLKQMGANIWARENNTKVPISIKGSQLSGIEYNSPIASAQIKSALMLSGLFADGKTIINEPYKSRDHSERMLKYLEANILEDGTKVQIQKSELTPKKISVPGDISSAAFFIVAGLIVPDSEILIKNTGLNPTRTGIIDVMKQMGGEISIINQRNECGEEIGDIKVNYSNLKGITIEKEMIPRVIDELPIIAIAATQANGRTIIKDAEDLRHKESDRIKAICSELQKIGASIEETPDGFIIEGKTKLNGDCIIETYHDHRIAMSAYVAGLISQKPLQIKDFDWVNISFPEFLDIFSELMTE